jgi:hypothetical protein
MNWRERVMKKSRGGGEFKYDIFGTVYEIHKR